MANIRKTYKSGAFEAIHSSASALHKIGAIDQAAMQKFDAAALENMSQRNLLTPSPKELQKALAQSAKQAEALAVAYGVKVPYAKASVARSAPATS